MDREDIRRMAREAGFHVEDDDYGNPMLVTDSGDLTKFAQLVAAHERDACAKECDWLTFALDHGGNEFRRPADAEQCAKAIRARNK